MGEWNNHLTEDEWCAVLAAEAAADLEATATTSQGTSAMDGANVLTSTIGGLAESPLSSLGIVQELEVTRQYNADGDDDEDEVDEVYAPNPLPTPSHSRLLAPSFDTACREGDSPQHEGNGGGALAKPIT